jgi:murein DD-endopeptidase MepM/ murein hydrolase activator NlpD
MRVRCTKCDETFTVPVTAAGGIEYSKAKNVFRVTYRFRTPCPKCHTVLQLAPAAKDSALGIPLETDTTEKTQFMAGGEGDVTAPRTMATAKAQLDPPPTVRVKPPQKPKVVSQRFRMLDLNGIPRRPVHVELNRKKGAPLPLVKIVLFLVIVASTTLTMALTVLAFRSGKSDSRTVPTVSVSAAFPSENTEAAPAPTPVSTPVKEAKAAPERRPDVGDEAIYLPKIEKLTSAYGKRHDPFTERVKMHRGLDIAEPHRAEILAALDGTVSFVGPKGTYGNLIIVKHIDGYETRYGHLAKALVKKGAKVKQGDLIGLAGSTGHSTGTHLHFELRKDGKSIDPFRLELISRVAPKRSRSPSG